MSRRYLHKDEVDAALRRGKSIECFLGPCGQADERGIRHLSLSLVAGGIAAYIFESRDCGGPNLLDLYEFGPLQADIEHGDPDEVVTFASLDHCLAVLDERWPGSSYRLVNAGVLQDEYADFVASGRR